MTFTIELSYPAPVLSPNARVHWAVEHKARQAQRNEAFISARSWLNTQAYSKFKSAHIALVFHPPDKRRRDGDNAMASCKSLLDGIADALRIDDSNFTTEHAMREPRKGGAVVVTVEAK